MEKVKINGEVPIPKKSLPDLFSRIDDLLVLLLKVESAELQVLKILAGIEEIEVVVPSEVIARPKGDTRAFNETAITTSDTYQKVCEIIVTEEKVFDLAYFACGCDKDIWIKLHWKGKKISPEIPVMANAYPQFWVPSEYQKVEGDGVKKFELFVKQISASGSAFGEIVGEEA